MSGKKSPHKPGIALLGNAENAAEAAVWESALRADGIPSMVRMKNPRAYYGATMPCDPYGYDVFVPATALRRAREILGSSLDGHTPAKDGNPRSGNFVTNVTVVLAMVVVILFAAATFILK